MAEDTGKATTEPSPEAMERARSVCAERGYSTAPWAAEWQLSIARAIDAAVAAERAIRSAEHAAELSAALDPKIVEAQIRDGKFEALVSGGTIALIFADAWWKLLTESKADNYVEVRCGRGDKEVIVTCQKVNGKTPAQLRDEAEKRLSAAVAEERERAARVCEAMVIGGRAWTHDQEVAAEALGAAALAIRSGAKP